MNRLMIRRLRRGARRVVHHVLPKALSVALVLSLLFVDFSHLIPVGTRADLSWWPNGLLLSTRVQLELQRLENNLAAAGWFGLGPQPAQAQSNPPFVGYWKYDTASSPAVLHNDAFATLFVKESNTLYVGMQNGVTAIDFLTNTKIADFSTPSKVTSLTAAAGEIAIGTDGNGVYITTPKLVQITQITQPTLYWVWGNYVADVKLIKEDGKNLLAVVSGYNGGISIVDRDNSNAAYYYRLANNTTRGIEYDARDANQTYFYVAWDSGLYRFPWRQNNHAVVNETMSYLGVVDGLYTYQAAHGKWTREPVPTGTQGGYINYDLGRVQFGAMPGSTPIVSYTFINLTGVDNPGTALPVDQWSTGSTPALYGNDLSDVMWHGPSASVYAVTAGHWLFGGAGVAKINGAIATIYNTTNNPGLQGGTYVKVAKFGDELYIANSNGLSRIHEVSGQITTATNSVTGNWRFSPNDLAVDGAVVFTAEQFFSSTILYRSSLTDGSAMLGRGTCDTNAILGTSVSACNGNASYSELDVALPGKGLPFAFARSFNAADTRVGPLGPGWIHGLDMAVTTNAFATVAIVRTGSGRRDKYQKNPDGSYSSQVGVYDVLVKNANGSWQLTQKDQTKINFDANGRLSSIADRNANAITPTFDGSGNLTVITDSAGRTITLAYTSAKLTSLTAPTSRTWTYAYDGNGRLSTVTNPLSGVTTYTYASDGKIATVTDPRGHVKLTNEYGFFGQLTGQLDAAGNRTSYYYSTQPSEFTTTDPRLKNTLYRMDELARVKEVQDHLGYKIVYTHQGDTPLRATITDKRNNVRSFTWDARGNMLTTTDPLSQTINQTFNASNSLTGLTDALGRAATFSYDANGNLTGVLDSLSRTWALTYTGAGLLASITDPLNHTKTFGYDGQGNLTTETDALAKTTTHTYDAAGRRLTDDRSQRQRQHLLAAALFAHELAGLRADGSAGMAEDGEAC